MKLWNGLSSSLLWTQHIQVVVGGGEDEKRNVTLKPNPPSYGAGLCHSRNENKNKCRKHEWMKICSKARRTTVVSGLCSWMSVWVRECGFILMCNQTHNLNSDAIIIIILRATYITNHMLVRFEIHHSCVRSFVCIYAPQRTIWFDKNQNEKFNNIRLLVIHFIIICNTLAANEFVLCCIITLYLLFNCLLEFIVGIAMIRMLRMHFYNCTM